MQHLVGNRWLWISYLVTDVFYHDSPMTLLSVVLSLVLYNKQVVANSLKALSIESSLDLLKVLRVEIHTSEATALQRLEAIIPLFQSCMGALLFLISALLSRGLVRFLTQSLLSISHQSVASVFWNLSCFYLKGINYLFVTQCVDIFARILEFRCMIMETFLLGLLVFCTFICFYRNFMQWLKSSIWTFCLSKLFA